MTVKVSVVVATYSPGDRMDRLVRSLDEQTMPTSEFEVVYVDDGSPDDDTWPRLQRIRDERPNVRIERIENSGWPSRPRNVGLDLARGEYVLFMDHDDELYPRALEAGYAFAARTGADVLNGKETRTDQSKWALEVYAENGDNVLDRTDIHPLIPTNPHKLFRRDFLLEHGIRFPEGRRVLWEDVFFALDCAPHLKVVSVMADTPFYHWVRGGETASSSYHKDRTEYWRWVREIVVQTNAKLGGEPRLHEQWRLFMLHQYRSRVLAPLGKALFSAPAEELDHVRGVVDELLREHIPVELDAYLTPTQLGRAHLLRAGRWDLLADYVEVDAALVGISRSTDVRWEDGVLRLTTESRWATTSGVPLQVRFDGDRVVRDLPAHVAAALPEAALDMTAALEQAEATVAVRNRVTAVVWPLPTTTRMRTDVVDGRPEPVLVAEATLDPSTAALGAPLERGTWDLSVRNAFLGAVNQRGLRTDTPSRNAVQDGHVYVAYRSNGGMLSFDVDQTARSLPGSAKLDPKKARKTVRKGRRTGWPLRRRTWEIDVRIPFRNVATHGPTRIEGTASAGGADPVPASIVAAEDGVWLETDVAQRPGTHPLLLQFHGRQLDSYIDLVIDDEGKVKLGRREP